MDCECGDAGNASDAVAVAITEWGGNAAAVRAEPRGGEDRQFSFGPETLTVPVGTTVMWTNRDDIPHTVVSTDGVFKSKVRDTDEKFSYTFTKPGTYRYFCSVHPKMTGKIIVQ